MSHLSIIDLGLMAYAEAWELQKRVVAARKAGAIEDVLLFCEHPHVITQGRSGKRANLLASENVLRQKGVKYFETTRGGDITYHGPGQIVGYPILNLGAIRRDVVWYVRSLEEAMIRVTMELGINANRIAGKTGIWVGEPGAEEKLAAIGVHISRWVTSHGFAYNVATDLRHTRSRRQRLGQCGLLSRLPQASRVDFDEFGQTGHDEIPFVRQAISPTPVRERGIEMSGHELNYRGWISVCI